MSERDEMHLIDQRAVQERDAKMNEEIKIARDRAHKRNALHERATLRDREFDDVTRELAASRQKANDAQSDYLNQFAAMAEEIKETRRELRSRKDCESNRTSKRHNSKTRKSNTTDGPQQQGQVMHLVLVYRHQNQLITASDKVLLFPVYQDSRR